MFNGGHVRTYSCFQASVISAWVNQYDVLAIFVSFAVFAWSTVHACNLSSSILVQMWSNDVILERVLQQIPQERLSYFVIYP